MRWYHWLAYLFCGAFLTNAVPHFVSGVTGTPFSSPFATPPGEGLLPPMINVCWVSANLVVAYLLLAKVGSFDLRKAPHAGIFGVGAFGMALMIAQHFGRVHGGH